MRTFVAKKRASHLALAFALATGTVLAVGGIAEPAYAQKKEKKQKAQPYSKEFVAAFNPVQEAVNAEGGDVSGVVAQIPGLVALANTPDEKLATGNIAYNVGVKVNQPELQYQGMKLMLESGKVDEANIGQYNFVAYQLANSLERYGEARPYLQKAMEYNFANDRISAAGLKIAMAENLIADKRLDEGLDYLSNAIKEQKAAGNPVDEQWYRRGLSLAYNNNSPKVYDFVTGWVADYPSATNWRDAVNIARNMNDYGNPEKLDLLRLGFRVDSLQDKQEYIDYIEAADPRRLPKEVETVINHGYSTGRVSKDDMYVADSLRTASGRISADKAELPSLERDANASGAALRTVMAAGDAFLNYGEYAKAETFYQKSLGMAGVNKDEALTRLGIAQAELGKYDEAKATFSQVTGSRLPIARLWIAYVDEKAGA